jgi:NADPH:quinone reductase-like Zn-dependent oxidoreductase
VIDALRDRVWPLLESGDIMPIVEAVVPVQEADRAHRLIAGNDTVGKVVIQIR